MDTQLERGGFSNVHSGSTSPDLHMAAEAERDSSGDAYHRDAETGSDLVADFSSYEQSGSGQYRDLGDRWISGIPAVYSPVRTGRVARSVLAWSCSASASEASGSLVEREAEEEFKRVWARMRRYEKDSRQLIRVSESVKTLARKVDRFSLAVTGLATAVVGDIIAHYVR